MTTRNAELSLFFLKLALLGLFASSMVIEQWWTLEQQIQKIGPVHGSVELMAKMVKMATKYPNSRVIVAGDSKAERQFDPRIFADQGVPAINVGIPSADLWSLVQTMEAVGLNRQPLTFLISVGSYQINDGNNDKGTYTPELFFSYTPLERLMIFKSGYFTAARGMLSKRETYEQFPIIIQQVLQSNWDWDKLGFLPVPANDYACSKFFFNSRSSKYGTYKNYNAEGGRWRLFEEAIRKLASWPGRYYLYGSPYSVSGLECLYGTYGETQERDFSRKVAQAVAPYSNVKFLDFFFDNQMHVPDSAFYDPGHMSEEGAQIFTKWWLDYLRKEKAL